MKILTPEEKARLIMLKKKELELATKLEEYYSSHELERFKPYWYQKAVYDAFREGHKIVITPLSNKVGKSRTGAALVMSWCKGYEEWNEVKEEDAERLHAVKVPDGKMFRYFMPSSLGIRPPVDITVTGEDWEEHAGKVLVPELKRFAAGPINSKDGEWTTTKNNMGVEADWKHKPTGSTISIRTYRQDPDLFESFKGHGWWPDEPPPQSIWAGMARALFITGGKIFMSMTPIKEPWIWDELILAQRADIKVIMNVSLWEAPHLYDHDIETLMKAGLTDVDAKRVLRVQKDEARESKYLPQTEELIRQMVGDRKVTFRNEFGEEFTQDGVVYVIQNLHIHRFIKELKDDSERLPRVFGEAKHLIGRVLKNFKYDVHVKPDFAVPVDWPVDFQIDFHPSENIAISFRACDPWGRNWIVDEVWAHLKNHQIVDEIVRRKRREGWRMDGGEIDALSKGDSAYSKNRHGESEDSYYEIERMLKKHGLKLRVASKAEENGIAKVDEWICADPPMFLVQRHCTETIRQIERWVRDKNNKPSPDSHFGENIYRFSQTGLYYTEMNEDEGEGDYTSIINRLKGTVNVPVLGVP